MRIDQNSYLNQIAFSSQISRTHNEGQSGIQGTQSIKGTDRIQISKEARQAYESYALNAKKKNDVPDAKEDFKSYLKRCREDPKTPEDRLKELQEELREVQEKIDKTAQEAGLANSSKPEIEEAGQQAPGQQSGPGGFEQDVMSLSRKIINPSSQAKLEALYIQMDQIVEEIKKVAEEL